jgi:hypothetical protein
VSSTEVANLIEALRSGTLTLEEVAQKFRERTWPRAMPPAPRTASERAGQWDPPPYVAGSVDDLTASYDRGELTWEQYRTLAEAVADSINAEYEAREDGSETGSSE